MDGPLRVSERGIGLIKGLDGFRARAIRVPDGGWLIGYGHTRTAREGAMISRADASLLLQYHDLPPIETLIRDTVLTPLSQNEFDALVCFAWNIGGPAFSVSRVLQRLNEGDRTAAADEMWHWRFGGADGRLQVIDALVRRRAAEISLFLAHVAGPVAIPGALVQPACDLLSDFSRALPADELIISGPERDIQAVLSGRPAAESVSDRMSRILGETAEEDQTGRLDEVSDRVQDDPSVEEITRAIADLVRPAPRAVQAAPPDDVARGRTLRPGNGPAEVPMTGGRPVSAGETAPSGPPSRLVDDLAPVMVDENRIIEAMREQEKPRPGIVMGEVSTWLPFALLSGLGLVGLFIGLQRLIARPSQIPAGAADLWLAPLLGLGGSMLFLVATYYLYLCISRQE